MVYNNNYCSIEDAWGNLTGPLPSKDKKKKKKSRDPICELYDMSANASYNDLDLVNASNSFEFEKYNKSRYQRDRQASREKSKFVQIDATADDDHVPLYEQNVSDDMDLEKQFATSLKNAQCSKSKIKMPDFESHFNPLTEEEHHDDAASDVESEEDYKEFKHILTKKKKDVVSDDEEEEHSAPPPRKSINEAFAEDSYYGVPMNKRDHGNNLAYLDLLLYIVSGIILIFVMEQFVKIGIMLQQ